MFFGFMPNRLNDVNVEIRIARDQIPKALAADVKIFTGIFGLEVAVTSSEGG